MKWLKQRIVNWLLTGTRLPPLTVGNSVTYGADGIRFDDDTFQNTAAAEPPPSGSVTTDVNGVATVTLNTPFPDINYSIELTPQGGVDTVTAMYNSKEVTGFGIKTEDDGGKVEPNAVVDWVCTKYSNP